MESDVQPAYNDEPGLQPDIMNDSAFNPQPRGTSKNSEEADSCRICRGDGTPEEPLFYPCKCSGSIKFVHQDCLMEWLSHSQKKHCELCKTPFRFTKLYHPQMPRTLPTTVFLHKAIGHVVRGFFTWCRGMLVASVWLFWLPWSMRFVWWGLFWIGDGGWVHETSASADASAGSFARSWNESSTSELNSSITSSPMTLNNFSSPINTILRHPLVQLFQLPKLLFVLRNNDQDNQPALPTSLSSTNSTFQYNGSNAGDSLLSAIPFFQNLTSSPVLNKVVTDILEGQIITLAVVVAFVLVFLIREWVVQQQPAINLGAMNQLEVNNRPEIQVEAREAAEEAELPRAEPNHSTEASSPNSNALSAALLNVENLDLSAVERLDLLIGADCANRIRTGSTNGPLKPNYAEKEHIERLVFKMEGTLAGFLALYMANIAGTLPEWGFMRDITTDVVALAMEVRRCLVALQDIASQALDEENAEALDVSLQNARLLRDGVVRCMPASLREDVIEPAEKTEQWISLGGQMLLSRKNLEESQRELQELKFQYTHKLQQSSEPRSISPVANATEDNATMSPSPLRPTMPSRPHSSIAAEIRRGMEESPQLSLVPVESGGALVDDGSDRASAASSGSWQRDESLNRVVTRTSNDALHQPTEEVTQEFVQRQQEPSNDPQIIDEIAGKLDRLDGSKCTDHIIPSPPSPETAAEESATETTNYNVAQASPSDLEPKLEDSDASGTVEVVPQPRPGIWDRLWEWLWGDIVPAEPEQQERENDDEHIVENVADEAPFVPFVDAVPQERLDDHFRDDDDMDDVEGNELPENAGLNQNDLEAVEDAEDLEGILELIGMQGPLAGLFQNSVFCAVLISATVTSAVWFPYLWGKVVLVFLANPLQLAVKVPWLLVSGLSNFAIDFCLFFGGVTLYWVDSLTRFAMIPVEWLIPSLTGMSSSNSFGKAMSSVADSALVRIAEVFITSNEATAPDFYHLSLSSHAALYAIRSNVIAVFVHVTAILRVTGSYVTSTANNLSLFPDILAIGRWLRFGVISAPQVLATFVTWLPDIIRSDALMPAFGSKVLPPLLANGKMPPWTTTDRLIAVVAGYAFFASAGALYLRVGSPITNSQRGKKIEAIVAEVLQQAGGVLKVILIISIEMLLFPLYCGFLLDIATLPLFEEASLASRFNFLFQSPWTSGFVHWFLGTCYMFHFALFVSMCRKIVRSGVLYFIRDPDDPTFHPVRDVLERNISSQLRKIGFSALVYGALVILCMGSVVWAVAYTFTGTFPIRWSSDTQLLEFPVDLLIYNTLTPFLIHLLRPSKGLHAIYEWWFRKCARALRLSHFLFGEEREDEEGRRKGENEEDVIRNGRFVRAPASDQVRVPKGRSVFVEVDANNKRLDGEPDDSGTEDSEASANYTKVFVPPWFRVRIAFFVFCLWALTAAAGLGFTVAPLLFGRWVLRLAVSPGTKINDIYTFSLGITTFGVILYTASSYRVCLDYVRNTFLLPDHTLGSLVANLRILTSRTLRLLYVYGALILLIPSLLALLLEFYFIMPLHAYVILRQSQNPEVSSNVNAGQVTAETTPSTARDHTIHFLQDWTLGLLYVRILIRVILWRPNTRPARALRAVVERGWHDPNASLATRCFILPCTVLAALALVVPAPLGWVAGHFYIKNASLVVMDGMTTAMYCVNAIRFAYPAVLAVAFGMWVSVLLWKAVGLWRGRIRDEVYLIGERLHNFGEMRPPAASKVRKVL